MAYEQSADYLRVVYDRPVSDAVFSTDGRSLFASSGGAVLSIDAIGRAGFRVDTFGTDLGALDVSPDGRYLVGRAGGRARRTPIDRPTITVTASIWRRTRRPGSR